MEAVLRLERGGDSGEGDSSTGDSSGDRVRSSLEEGEEVRIIALLVRTMVPISRTRSIDTNLRNCPKAITWSIDGSLGSNEESQSQAFKVQGFRVQRVGLI